MDPCFKIREMTVEDLKLVIEWANQEGWMFSETDAESFLNADPHGFFIGELDGVPVCSFAAIKQGDYCFWNLYIVKEQCRGKGYGSKIFEHARNYCKDSKVLALDACGPHIKNYEKYGFKGFCQTISYTKKAEGTLSSKLVDLKSLPIDDLAAYDAQVFGYDRKSFLKSVLQERSYHALGAKKDGKITGYGILRKYPHGDGYIIGPLNADDKDTANEILEGLQSYIEGRDVFLEIFDNNPDAMEIIEKQNWEHVMTFTRMYARGIPNMDMGRNFCPVDEIS